MSAVYDRLRCRIVDLAWYEDPNFKLDDHIEEVTVTSPETLSSILAEYCSELLPEDRAMWKLTLVHDKLASRDIVVFRSHHAIGDGLALVQMVDWLFDIETRDVVNDGFDLESGLYSDERVEYEAREKHRKENQDIASISSVGSNDRSGGKNNTETHSETTFVSPLPRHSSFTSSFRDLDSECGIESNHGPVTSILGKETNFDGRAPRSTMNTKLGISSYHSQSSIVPMNDNADAGSVGEYERHGRFRVDDTGMYSHGDRKKKKKRSYFVLVFRVLWLLLLSPFRTLAILFMASDPPNIFKHKKGGKVSQRKAVAMSCPIDLARIKAVGKAVKGTVNDVVVATTALAIRNHMLAHFNNDESKLPSFVRCILPVSLREPMSKQLELNNRVSAVFVSLPLKEQNPKIMLKKIKRRMDRLKSYPDAFIVYALIAILVKWLPSRIFMRVQAWFYSKNTILLSNVPGRKKEAYMAGSKVNDMYFWVPLIGNGAVGLSIYSYIDHVVFSCLADPEVVGNPSDLCKEYQKAFDHLERMVLGQNYENQCSKGVEEQTLATLEASKEEEARLKEAMEMADSVDIQAAVTRAKAEKKARQRSQRDANSPKNKERSEWSAEKKHLRKEKEKVEKEKERAKGEEEEVKKEEEVKEEEAKKEEPREEVGKERTTPKI